MSDVRRRIIGALIGGGLGVLAYWVALRNGFDALAFVAVGPGVGSDLAARRRSLPWGLAIALVSVALSVLINWLFLPFAVDGSLGYFLSHLGHLPLRTHLTFVAAAGIGFYFGMGRHPKKRAGKSD
ncbi:MAG: hypothetical protein O7H41_14785 [Planctomycetota bacterium]|nr:hypothetical protein [Planctomycetota bacterium]